MARLSALFACILAISPFTVHSSNLPTVLAPFSITPSVEVLRSPVTRVETINIAPRVVKSFSSSSGASASAVAVASAPGFTTSTVPVVQQVQRIESYSSGDSNDNDIRNLLRSLLSELRNTNTVRTSSAPVRTSYGPPSDSYGPPPQQPSDSYGPPSKNTFTDYQDSRPEKVVLVQDRQVSNVITSPAAIAQVQTTPVAVREVVRTVYQPVYVPIQYAAAPQQEYVTVAAQPVTQTVPVAVPTTVKTGASAVAISTIHSQPAYAIQQQQVSVPYVQEQFGTLSTIGTSAVLDTNGGGYRK